MQSELQQQMDLELATRMTTQVEEQKLFQEAVLSRLATQEKAYAEREKQFNARVQAAVSEAVTGQQAALDTRLETREQDTNRKLDALQGQLATLLERLATGDGARVGQQGPAPAP